MRPQKPDWRSKINRTLWTLVFFFPLLLLILVTQLLQEYFPFSHFPMYNYMREATFYVYLTDGEDNPIPSVPVVGERTTKLKRIYDTEIRRIHKELDKRKYELTIEERLPAGLHTLNWVVDSAMSRPGRREKIQEHDSIRLYQAMVLMEDGKVTRPPAELVGEVFITPKN